jgi:hypothetical protein
VSLRFLGENDSGTLKEGNLKFDPDTEGLFLTARSGTNPDLFVKSDGNVGIGNTAPSKELTVEGEISASGNVHTPGIKFDASGEVLGDYEEGSWSPEFGAVTKTQTAQGGAYIRIGKMVHCEGFITVSSIDNSDGSGVQFGLPFNADGDQAILMTLDNANSGLLTSAGHTAMTGARMGTASNSVVMTQDNGSDFTYGEGLNSSGTFTFAFQYIA